MGDSILIGEAARLLGISAQRVRELVDSGRLPAERGTLGVRVIERRAVEDLARERRQRRPRDGALGISARASKG